MGLVVACGWCIFIAAWFWFAWCLDVLDWCLRVGWVV